MIVCPFCKVQVISHEAMGCLDAWLALSVLKQAVNTIQVVDHIRGYIGGDGEVLRTEYEAYPADLAARDTAAIPPYSANAEAIQTILAASLVGVLAFAERVALSLRQGGTSDPNDLVWEARLRPITEEKSPEWWAATAPTFPLAVARAVLIAREAT